MTSKKVTNLQKSFGTAHAELSIAKRKKRKLCNAGMGGK